MALSSVQQNSLLKLTVGLFNAAPGAFYTQVEGIVLGTTSEAAAADILMGTDAFQAIIPSKILTNQQFAAKFIDFLVGSNATAANKAWAAAQVEAQLNGGATQGTAAWWAIDQLSKVSTSNADWGNAAAALNNKLDVAKYFTVDQYVASASLPALQGLLIDVTSDAASVAVAKASAVSTSINLSTTVETTNGTAGADLFKAFLSNGANTLQSGDVIRGGAGNDTLMADMATAENAVAFETQSVEKITLRSQHTTTPNGDNNLAAAKVTVDAERAAAVGTWHNLNSRADLIIEDVRIADGKKTKDVSIVMESTDPGNVDFGVYFDQKSLRNSSSSSTTLTIKLMDTGAAGNAATAATPLLNNPYDQFKLGINGVLTTIQLDKTAVAAADTYAALLTVFQNALAGTAGVSAALGNDFTITDPISNTQVTGKEIVLTGTTGIAISAPAGSGWYNTTGASVPPTSNIYTTYNDAAASVAELVTSTIVLDDVGRGSTGGDLVVGGLSVGVTSTSRGVERFEIEVRDNSKLQTINSTNDALREVVIVNGATTNTDQNQGVYDKTATNAGNLTVNGNANSISGLQGDVGVGADSDTMLPGLDATHHNGAFGFTDVRLIDGSAMTGKLAFTAQVTSASIAKYHNLVDTQNSPTADVAGTGNVNYNVKGANFIYSGGGNDDTISVTIDSATAASNTENTSKPDFTFNVNGNAGNDAVTVAINEVVGSTNWLADQQQLRNITINTGTGNDTVRTPSSGNFTVLAGDGNDTVYLDNTGNKTAIWQINAGVAAASNNLLGDAIVNNFLFKGKLTVVYSAAGTGGGVTAGAAAALTNGFETTVDIPTGDNYNVNQYYLNQAIKAAINLNPVLSKVLVAQDNAAGALTVTSLIDGTFVANDLLFNVSYTTPTGADLTAMNTAYKAWLTATNIAQVVSADTASTNAVTALNLVNGVGTTILTTDSASGLSTQHSDNIINLGAGDDVAVLGTSATDNDILVFTGYDQGKDTIINFDNAGADIDRIDFRSYLNGKVSTGALAVDQYFQVAYSAGPATEANSVTILSGMGFDGTAGATTNTFAGLTAANFLTAVNTTGHVNYAGIVDASLTANGVQAVIGGVAHSIVLVENDDNLGEYKVFDMAQAANGASDDFTSATLIGTVDFGSSIDLSVAGSLVLYPTV